MQVQRSVQNFASGVLGHTTSHNVDWIWGKTASESASFAGTEEVLGEAADQNANLPADPLNKPADTESSPPPPRTTKTANSHERSEGLLSAEATRAAESLQRNEHTTSGLATKVPSVTTNTTDATLRSRSQTPIVNTKGSFIHQKHDIVEERAGKRMHEQEIIILEVKLANTKLYEQSKEVEKFKTLEDDKEVPIKFKDAVGRKFSFPWKHCKTWKVGKSIKALWAKLIRTGNGRLDSASFHACPRSR